MNKSSKKCPRFKIHLAIDFILVIFLHSAVNAQCNHGFESITTTGTTEKINDINITLISPTNAEQNRRTYGLITGYYLGENITEEILFSLDKEATGLRIIGRALTASNGSDEYFSLEINGQHYTILPSELITPDPAYGTISILQPNGTILGNSIWPGDGSFIFTYYGNVTSFKIKDSIASLKPEGGIFDVLLYTDCDTNACPPIIITNQPSDVTVCENVTHPFSISASNAVNYKWQENNGLGWKDLMESNTYSGTNTSELTISPVSITMNNYQYRCMISNACSDTFSLPATLTINTPDSAYITISADATTICKGAEVFFTAAAINGGNNPFYQWKKNGIDIGSNDPTYSDTSFVDDDSVICTLVSNEVCVSPKTAISNTIHMSVNPAVVPYININSSADIICAGTEVIFHATTTNEGSDPSFKWERNGLPVGSDSSVYVDANLLNNDVITCQLISNDQSACLTSPKAISNNIVITVFEHPHVIIDKTAILCQGSTNELDAGDFISYLWSDGSTGKTVTISTPGIYYVMVTDKNGCAASDTTNVTAIMQPPVDFLPADTSLCSNDQILLSPQKTFANYLWNTNSSMPSITVSKPNLYWLEVTDNNMCKGRDTIIIRVKECLPDIQIPTAFTPNNDGKNDYFKPIISGKIVEYQFQIYNRWGNVVFQTTDINKAWNGNYPGKMQDCNVFVWVCSYKFENESKKIKKGTVLLLK